jgi:outer membrane protein OmpA-like peptidoglycan-associated protein
MLKRKQYAGTFLTVVFLALCPAWPCHAHFQAQISGVRPAGMGGAFTGVADDPNAFLFNPAGVVQMEQIYFAGMYSELFSNMNARIYTGQNDHLGYHLLSLGVPLDPSLGAVGVSWTRFASLLYQENSFYATYGRSFLPDKRLALGINLKLLEWAVDVPASDQAEGIMPYADKKWGGTADLGVLYVLTPAWKAGVGAGNVVPTRLGDMETNDIPMQFRAGTAYTLDVSRVEPLSQLTGALDVTFRKEIWNYCFGAELWMLQRQIGVRAGLNTDEFSAGVSYRPNLPKLALGVQLDYAFTYAYQVEDTAGTHRLGLTMAWNGKINEHAKGKGVRRETPPKRNETRKSVAQLEVQKNSLTVELKKFSGDIEAGYSKPICFEFGRKKLKKDAFPTLIQLGKILEKYPDVLVRIEGHTDDVGTDEYNAELSRGRAEIVRACLVRYFKIRKENLVPTGLGKTRPLTADKTVNGKRRNRRLELKVFNPLKFNIQILDQNRISSDSEPVAILASEAEIATPREQAAGRAATAHRPEPDLPNGYKTGSETVETILQSGRNPVPPNRSAENRNRTVSSENSEPSSEDVNDVENEMQKLMGK